MFTDAQGSIREIYDRDGNVLFRADYDPWGNITFVKNDIGFIRGYTGHEMLPEFGLINMNGRMYDPQLGRFLSPDNYVQMPDNSQNFNRYSYCLNNPLKYTDPSGEAIGIDDLLIITAMGAISGMISSNESGGSVWNGALIGGLSSAATYGVGALFGHTLGTFGNEILRASSHGLANGVIGTINGHKFSTGFASGFMSSLAGSGIQASGIESSEIMHGGCFIVGGLTSQAFGDDFIYGANIGWNIASYNHGWKYDKNGNRLYYELDEVIVLGQRKNLLLNEGRNFNNFMGNVLYGFDNERYKPLIVGAAFDFSLRNKKIGLKSVETMSKNISPYIIKRCSKINNITSIAFGFYDTCQGYIKDGYNIGYNTTKIAANNVSGIVGGAVAAKYGFLYGGMVGSSIGGVGALPGSIIGGVALGIAGSYGASCISDFAIDLMW